MAKHFIITNEVAKLALEKFLQGSFTLNKIASNDYFVSLFAQA